MRTPRPHVPIGVKVAVAGRQVRAAGLSIDWNALEKLCSSDQLRVLLNVLYPDIVRHLDHDPPLMLRDRTKSGGYLPDANDTDYLTWRTAEDHRLKTFIRGPGARRSDVGERRAVKKRASNKIKKQLLAKGKRPKGYRPIKGRSQWPTGRKFPTGG